MGASVIVPVWNGAKVVVDCLDAIFHNTGAQLQEVVCVDNASADESAGVIAQGFPQVRLIRNSVNLGFGGGVNIGMRAAASDVFVLLNQDCLPKAGWLDALLGGLAARPTAGIAGATLFNVDGSIDHAGARVTRPLAHGEHLTEAGSSIQPMDYVTGAMFAITRVAYTAIGDFDEGFYPAYYEESDYCYRARAKGFESIYVPNAGGQHMRSSREWQRDGLQHSANQHRSRNRFVLKHFDDTELGAFFEAECAAAMAEAHYDQALGRAIAVRTLLRQVDEVAARRKLDLNIDSSPMRQRTAKDALAKIYAASVARAQVIAQCDDAMLDQMQAHADAIRQRIDYRDEQPASGAPSGNQLHLKRLRGMVNGRDWALQAQLHAAQAAQMDALRRRGKLLESLMTYDQF